MSANFFVMFSTMANPALIRISGPKNTSSSH